MINELAKQPSIKSLLIPTIRAIESLGGDASNADITAMVIKSENIPSEVALVLHNVGPKTIVEYRLAWARSCLKKFGAIENTSKGRWRLTPRAAEVIHSKLNDVYKALHSSPVDTR
jgi:restriction system protein